MYSTDSFTIYMCILSIGGGSTVRTLHAAKKTLLLYVQVQSKQTTFIDEHHPYPRTVCVRTVI